MSLRFWRRIRLAPGITLNLSKSTASLSLGPRGAKYTLSPRGNRLTLGLPGTGLFYTYHQPRRGSSSRSAKRKRLKLGFFQRLTTPAEERSFIEALEQLDEGRPEAALQLLERGANLPDAAWLAGMLHLRQEKLSRARQHLLHALEAATSLGELFAKYELDLEVGLPVTPDIQAHLRPGEAATRLALVEIAQQEGDHEAAWAQLEQLLQLVPEDPIVLLSFAELALDKPEEQELMRQVVELTAAVQNETPIDSAILYYRGRALAALGLPEAAIEVFTLAHRRRKDRPRKLLQQIRYERALLYQKLGRRAQARREFEKLYAEDPHFEVLEQILLNGKAAEASG